MTLKLELKIDPCPSRGGGLNTWMFKTAAHLARHGVSQAEAQQFISAQAGDSARPGEVDRQVEQGYSAATGEEPVRIESGEFIITKKPRTPSLYRGHHQSLTTAPRHDPPPRGCPGRTARCKRRRTSLHGAEARQWILHPYIQ